jgi:hypothetical protein
MHVCSSVSNAQAVHAAAQKLIPFLLPRFMEVPLYSRGDRSKMLTVVQMPVADEAEVAKWTLSGLALFSSED